MGFALWVLETFLALAAGYALAIALLPGRDALERWMATLLFATASIFSCLQALGLAQLLSRLSLSLLAAALHLALLAWVLRRAPLARLRSQLLEDLRRPYTLLLDCFRQRELAAWAFVPACAALIVSSAIVWHLPSWSWDVVWYHTPKTYYALQEHSTRWVSTHIWYINGYPELTELLAAWNVLFPRDTRFDDASQLPFVLLGGFAVAAFCRRGGAGRVLSASLGAMWIALPAVFLQAHTTHADITAGALFITAFYFFTERPWPPSARALTFIALGLYAATKVTGLFHAALLAPLLLVRLVLAARQERLALKRFALGLALSLLAFVWLGSPTAVENTLRTGNPLWPARVRLLGHELEGPILPEQIAGPPAFFGAPGAFSRMVDNWTATPGAIFPDIRESAFGLLFPYLLLPALFGATVIGLFSPRLRFHALSLATLAGLSVLVPAAWWGRFTLGLPAAGLAALALLHRHAPSIYLRAPLSAFAAFLSVVSYVQAVPGYRVLPHLGPQAGSRISDEDRLRLAIGWLWPPDVARLRESELQPGDIVAYDNSVVFLGEFWTRDLRNRVQFLPHAGDDDAYLEALGALQPRWVCVGAGSPAHALLLARPEAFEFLFQCPLSQALMYRVRSLSPGSLAPGG